MWDIESYEFLQSEYERAKRVLRDNNLQGWVALPNQRVLSSRIDPDDYRDDLPSTRDEKEGDFWCQGCGKWFGKTMTFTGYVCHICTGAI